MRRDDVAKNLAEVVESTFDGTLPRDRRVALVEHHVRRAWIAGYRAGMQRAKQDAADQQVPQPYRPKNRLYLPRERPTQSRLDF
jgi:hypothetical protein